MYGFLPYKTNLNKITTNLELIKPGMIYVDLSRDSTNNILAAYERGAKLIITQDEFHDEKIPIINVQDINNSLLSILDILHGRPLQNINFIPIYGGSCGIVAAKVLEQVFKKSSFDRKKNQDIHGRQILDILSLYDNSIIERFFYCVLNCFMQNINIIPISYDKSLFSMIPIIRKNSECEIIIEYNPDNIKELSMNKGDKTLFINIDDPYALDMTSKGLNNVIITFGLNKKAAVTATSIDYGERTSFNYCLQRTMISKTGLKIEPFEIPLSIKGMGISRIHLALATVSCGLYYDIDLGIVKESLINYTENGRNFFIKRYKNFTFIDNYCISLNDYKETFEMLQFVAYKNLYIVLSNNPLLERISGNKIINIVKELAVNLGVKEILCINHDYRQSINICEEDWKEEDLLKGKPKIRISNFYQLNKALSYGMSKVSEGDLLLTIGGKEMDDVATILEFILS